MKISRKEERLSPEIPISATNAAGSAVRHKAMIRAVRPRGAMKNRHTNGKCQDAGFNHIAGFEHTTEEGA